MATSFLPATVLRSSGEWPCTSALGLLTRKYSALRSNVSPLSKATVSALRSLCNRNSVGHGCDAVLLISIHPLSGDVPYRYSITSSARASSVGGTSRPSVFAVLRLSHPDQTPDGVGTRWMAGL